MSFLTVPQVVTLLDDRDPPPKIKKAFLKGLYAANKDLSAWQCVPRWPCEAQVLPQSIKHIRSVPVVSSKGLYLCDWLLRVILESFQFSKKVPKNDMFGFFSSKVTYAQMKVKMIK